MYFFRNILFPLSSILPKLRTGTFPPVVDTTGHALYSVNDVDNERATGRLIIDQNTSIKEGSQVSTAMHFRCSPSDDFRRRRVLGVNYIIIIIIIIIIFIYCNCVVSRWQWLFYMYTKYEIGYY